MYPGGWVLVAICLVSICPSGYVSKRLVCFGGYGSWRLCVLVICVLVSMCPDGFQVPGTCDNEEEELSITSCASMEFPL